MDARYALSQFAHSLNITKGKHWYKICTKPIYPVIAAHIFHGVLLYTRLCPERLNHKNYMNQVTLACALSYLHMTFYSCIHIWGREWIESVGGTLVNSRGYAPLIRLKWRFLADMPTFMPTKRIFLDSQILSHWYHFEAQLVGSNIWNKSAFYRLNFWQ